MIYENYQRNHVILPGREHALASFLQQDYKGMQHNEPEQTICGNRPRF
ncbi:hypothetical protein [Thiorhodovibrio litoralis]|nr:hypothetical protein [Thiorhodovibrio litoralis]WPL13655.1 hypothetical protein Thiosp_03468 [Thiorhodovibrio litoralis]